jgi:hypothetical protein
LALIPVGYFPVSDRFGAKGDEEAEDEGKIAASLESNGDFPSFAKDMKSKSSAKLEEDPVSEAESLPPCAAELKPVS